MTEKFVVIFMAPQKSLLTLLEFFSSVTQRDLQKMNFNGKFISETKEKVVLKVKIHRLF